MTTPDITKTPFTPRPRTMPRPLKKKDLEIYLQQIPTHPNPDPSLEQYQTPATIAADIIFTAYQHGDLQDQTIVDLGCGTGIFAIGAYLAGATQVTGIDIDPTAINLARHFATQHNLPITYEVAEIAKVTLKADTVLMNPPFGAQKSNKAADRRFLEKAFTIAPVIYSLHLTKTVPFLNTMIHALQGEITMEKDYQFPLPAQFSFHTKLKTIQDVSLLRIETKPSTEPTD
jgi:putative methylase